MERDGARSGEIHGGDPFASMSLRLTMLVEVRCGALKRYRELSDEARARADETFRAASGRIERERFIDSLERGEFT